MDEFARPVSLDGPHLLVTGQAGRGRTTLCRTLLSEIARVRPGSRRRHARSVRPP